MECNNDIVASDSDISLSGSDIVRRCQTVIFYSPSILAKQIPLAVDEYHCEAIELATGE